MANLIFNVALGKVAYYASLPGVADSFVVIALETAGMADDDTMRDYDTLAALLAGPSNEQTDAGRVTLAGVGAPVDDTGNSVTVDAINFSWVDLIGEPIGAIVLCYKPDTASPDSAIIPLVKQDCVPEVEPSGATISVSFDAAGILTIEQAA